MADLAQRRAQLEARLERQQQLYELGDWTRDRYLLARQEVLRELAEVDTAAMVAQPEQHVEALERLGAYVREVKAAWSDADKANKRLLVRTLFEQLWVLGDHIVAATPVAQFAPFFRLMRGTVSRGEASAEGDVGMQLLYLDATSSAAAEDTEVVGELAYEIARDTSAECHGREANVRASGPDGRRIIWQHSRVTACSSAPLVSPPYTSGAVNAHTLWCTGSAVWADWLARTGSTRLVTQTTAKNVVIANTPSPEKNSYSASPPSSTRTMI